MTRCCRHFGRLSLILPLVLAGCRAPTPSLDASGLLGATRVPPPPTGAFNQSQNYYPGPTSEPSGAKGSTSGRVGASISATDSAQAGTIPLPAAGNVTAASYQERASEAGASSPQPTPAIRSGLNLRGMPVNDATGLVPTPATRPPTEPLELSQLPPAQTARPSSLLQILAPKPATGVPPATTTAWQAR